MKIKEEDELKAAFITLEGLFEIIVMFFDLTNSPATFQAMMDELLRDLINIEKVGSFIDDIIVETESKKGHDELVEEILRRMEENNVKPEKCKWKVREIDFLGVVIGPKGRGKSKSSIRLASS